jgi:MFS family permease
MKDLSCSRNPLIRVLSLHDFRLLFAATSLSRLGDQFALIATPWLVLQLTGDPVVLGTVLALTGLPRVAFMLIGGAVSDWLSPRRIMLIADIVRLVLTALMSLAVLSGTIEIWMVYIFGFCFGVLAGFAVPAENSIVPRLVGTKDLQAGNSLVMGAGQVAGFVGPTLAGIIIGSSSLPLNGVAFAYGIDAVTFAISAICLLLIRGARPADSGEKTAAEGIVVAIRAAFDFVWNDRTLRLMFVMLAALNFLIIGPLLVGIPLLAKTRLAEGAFAYGILMSAFAGGSLLGCILAGALPRPNAARIKMLIIALEIGFGLATAALGLVTSTAVDFGMLLLLGLGDGYLSILLFTWMQSRTPGPMLGRVMSFLMVANSGLVPVSQAIAGALGQWDLTVMLMAAGSLTVLMTLFVWTRPELTDFSNSLANMASAPAE